MYFRTAGELHRCIKCVGLLGFLYAGTSPNPALSTLFFCRLRMNLPEREVCASKRNPKALKPESPKPSTLNPKPSTPDPYRTLIGTFRLTLMLERYKNPTGTLMLGTPTRTLMLMIRRGTF